MYVAKGDGGAAHWARVTSLDGDVTIRLERVRWLDEYQPADRVRALHPGREAVECEVVGAENRQLALRLCLR